MTTTIPAALALCLLATQTACAGSPGGGITLTSDYLFRGLSQTRGNAAVQGDLHYTTDNGWFLGGFASTVDLNPGRGATIEVDGYLGHAWQVSNDWNARLMAVHYEYPNDSPDLPYDYDELVGALSFQDLVAVTVAWSPNTDGYSLANPAAPVAINRAAYSVEVAGRWPLIGPLTTAAGAGFRDLNDLFQTSYWYWNAGVGLEHKHWILDVSYFGTSDQARRLFGKEIAHDRWSITVAWRL